MTESRGRPIKVKVHDKRRTREAAAAEDTPPAAVLEDGPDSSGTSSAEAAQGAPSSSAPREQPNFEDLYLRAVADLENERKRFKLREREQAERALRALVESLLPVLDNFERAISHGEGGEGVALVFKEFRAVLEREGLEEIPAEGVEFDPNVHEAVESRVAPDLEVPTVIEVYRRGYLLKGQVLRAAMVVVGRPEDAEQIAVQD